MIVILMITASACEEPGVVGGNIVDEGASVRIDTLKIDDYNLTSEPPVFTGNRAYVSAGQYEDALFGDLTAAAVMRPALGAAGLDTLHPEAEFMLELGISAANVYGDTTSTSELEVREIARAWRANAWKLNSPVDVNQKVNAEPVQIGMQDSVVVPLDASWYKKYREFFYKNSGERDSLYRYNFNGIALRHVQGNKILAIDTDRSSFLIRNPGDTTATEIPLQDWAYSLDRSNVPSLPDSLDRIYSTQEKMNSFNFVSNDSTLGSKNISRAELRFHTAHERMQNSLPKNHVRPVADVFNLYLLNPSDLEYSLIGVRPSFSVQIDSVDYYFSVDLTSYINQQLYGNPVGNRRFYGTLRSNNGVIRSTLIYDSQATNLFPKILITSVNPDLDSN